MQKSFGKRVRFLCGILLFLVVFLVPLNSNADSTAVSDENLYEQDNSTIQILFVGNSLTRRNHMPKMFQKLAAEGGYEVYVEELCISGCSLKQWANRNTTAGSRFYRRMKARNWDYVVLQEQSTRIISKPKSFKKAVKKLSKVIHENGAEVVLNMTWAHNKESDIYDRQSRLTQKKFQKKVYKAYTEMGNCCDALVANSGVAFWRCQQTEKEINLFKGERHPSKAGSYLSACTLYATIFQEDIPENDLGLSEDAAEILRQIAEKVTFTNYGIM